MDTFFITFLALSFLIGTIPFGFIYMHMAGKGDLRKMGSNNVGATNALRAGGKKIGALTLISDLTKGMIPIVLAIQFLPGSELWCLLATVLGHMFPPWLKFKGGKGVATAAGGLFVFSPLVGLLCLTTHLITITLTRVSAIASLVMVSFAPLWTWILIDSKSALITMLIGLLIILKHAENIGRILNKTEKKLGNQSGETETDNPTAEKSPRKT